MAGASSSVPWCPKRASVPRRCDSSKWAKLTLGKCSLSLEVLYGVTAAAPAPLLSPAWPQAQQEMAGSWWFLSEPIYQLGWLFSWEKTFCFRVLLGNGVGLTADHNSTRNYNPLLL